MDSNEAKINFANLKKKILNENGRTYWRSIEEYVDTPEFEDLIKREYPSQAEEWDDSLSRRKFVKVMGASLALAGVSGCVIQPAEQIVPYVTQPEGLIPGKPRFYATSMTLGGVANGLFARSNDGRPTKIEGNPDHPGSLGATDVFSQASLLNLYDPDRSNEILFRGSQRTWQNFTKSVRTEVDKLRGEGGAGIHFLTETITSPTLIDQFARITQEMPNVKWHQYEPVNNDNPLEGSKKAFGAPAQPLYKFEKAERILSLDADIFSGFNVRYMKDFAKGRAISEDDMEMNRLYAIETTMSLTGAKADHRLAVKPSQMPEIAKAIAAAIGVSGATSDYLDKASEREATWISEMAKDLQEFKGKSLVIAGNNQPADVHAIAYAINDTLGNIGETLDFIEPLAPNSDKSQKDQLAELVKEIDGGSVKMLIVLGGNPVYNAPSDLKFDKARLEEIPMRIHVGEYRDETAVLCHWHVAAANYLESWGDSRGFDGTVTLSQPLIKPLNNGRSVYEIVQLFLNENFEKKDLEIVQEYWQKQNLTVAIAAQKVGEVDEKESAEATDNGKEIVAAIPVSAPKNFEENWRLAIHNGFVAGSEVSAKPVSISTAFLSEPSKTAEGVGDIEISIMPDPSVHDGRFTNNAWLQELPNPLTKITWENVALVSPNTAEKLGINGDKRFNDYAGGELGRAFLTTKGGNLESDLIEITYEGKKMKTAAPAWIAPGQPDDVITIFLGYGRERAGKIGTGIGYNAYEVRTSDSMWFGKGEIVNTNVKTSVASTQIHFNISEKEVGTRDIIRNWGIDEYEHNVEEKAHEPKEEYDKSMYGNEFGEVYDAHDKWAMTIDLNSCVGCNSCVLACQSENNIPVVGKEQIERSREMHWMRIDAYYSGNDINEPDGPNFQPVLCQQCEQAPCEVVCPVHATAHSAEGLNDMVYNRCIGTRYCSNNCPYKVRRFNFLLYQDWDTPEYKLMRNPEVTVRSRGVMEKCTYCTQKISAARIESEKEGRAIRDGEVVTACQSACPTDAIVFGNMGDEKSAVAKSKKDKRNYALLNEQLNTQPRTTYLAGVRNQNNLMPDYIPSEKTEGGESH